MAVLDELGTYLAANVSAVTLTLGTNLFLGRMPDDPDTCVAVYQTTGQAPTDVYGADSSPPLENVGLMVHTRAASYSTCESLAVDVMKTASKVINESLSGVRWLKVVPNQSPFALVRDDRDRMLFSCNFAAVKVL